MTSRTDNTGRAYAGSQRQIQTYVNSRQEILDQAIISAIEDFPATGKLVWTSPLEQDQYTEYQDKAILEFLSIVHLWEKHITASR